MKKVKPKSIYAPAFHSGQQQAGAGQARILILDIETAPIMAHVWRTWKENVGLEQITHDWYILSFSAKWYGSQTVMYDDQSKATDIEDDSRLMLALHALLDEADIVVAHNGRAFDVRKINARFILNGLKPPSPYKIVDTLEIAKKNFAFTSNRLAYLTDKLCTIKKLEHGKFPGFMLWKECLKGNPEAWREMRTYNVQDVTSLEELYTKLRAWDSRHPNVDVASSSHEHACPCCGSHKIIRKGFAYTNSGQYQKYLCTACGKWSRTRYTENPTAKRKGLLTNIGA